ncbi:hypothetical protein AB0C90_35460 [Streptomyces sp. NPDC048550]|uniref:hypothetical protein n=1 Tax=Streptomyces sp. NPDC048550 TaxID=3155739 RepID=UPI00341540E8
MGVDRLTEHLVRGLDIQVPQLPIVGHPGGNCRPRRAGGSWCGDGMLTGWWLTWT